MKENSIFSSVREKLYPLYNLREVPVISMLHSIGFMFIFSLILMAIN